MDVPLQNTAGPPRTRRDPKAPAWGWQTGDWAPGPPLHLKDLREPLNSFPRCSCLLTGNSACSPDLRP